MSKTANMTVWAQDPFSADIIPRSFRIFRKPDLGRIDSRDIFVLTSVPDLSVVTEFVRAANHRNHLRILFVREDDNAQLLPQMLYEANLRMTRNILVHSDKDVPKRVLTAWSLGCPDQLIATAQVIDDELLVVACDHTTLFRVGFEEMPALKRIPEEQRSSFTISSEGSYIHWPEADVHIDLDAVRYLKDDIWREKKDRERLMSDIRFGEAVAAFRKQCGLKQVDIQGISERHVRRIEKGERTKVDTLEILARSHGLSLKVYLNKIAEILYEGKIEKGERIKVDTQEIPARSHGLSLKVYLNKIAEILYEGGEVTSKVSTLIPQDTIDIPDSIPVAEDDEIGLPDLEEELSDNIAELEKVNGRIVSATEEVGEKMQTRTQEVNSLAENPQPNFRRQFKSIVNRVAFDMHHYSARIDAEIPLFKKHLDSTMTLFTKIVALYSTFDSESDDMVPNMLSGIEELKGGLDDAERGMEGFRDSVSGLPPMTRELNHAKEKTIDVLQRILDEIQGAKLKLGEIEGFMN